MESEGKGILFSPTSFYLSPFRCRGSSLHVITQWHTHTLGRTPLKEWSAHRKGVCVHNTHKRHTSMHPAGFEPAISAVERLHRRPHSHRGSENAFSVCNFICRRSQCPNGLTRGSVAGSLLGLRVWILPGAWMSVRCECCVLLRRGLCDGPIPRPEESYRLWSIIVCHLGTLAHVGLLYLWGGGDISWIVLSVRYCLSLDFLQDFLRESRPCFIGMLWSRQLRFVDWGKNLH